MLIPTNVLLTAPLTSVALVHDERKRSRLKVILSASGTEGGIFGAR